jgi:hypothetical protein
MTEKVEQKPSNLAHLPILWELVGREEGVSADELFDGISAGVNEEYATRLSREMIQPPDYGFGGFYGVSGLLDMMVESGSLIKDSGRYYVCRVPSMLF